MDKANAFYAQSGGVTAVINASAYGVINQLQTKYKHKVDKIYAGNFGIIGALEDDLIEVSEELDLAKLAMTPGGYFGSCRYKLKSIEANRGEYTQLVEVIKNYNIKYYLYNGAGD